MRVLITGSEGLIGSAVTAAAIEAGHQVTTLDRKPSGQLRSRHVTADVRDLESVISAAKGADRILHLGAVTSATSAEILDIAIRGMTSVVLAAESSGGIPIVHLSSINAMGVTGPDADPPLTLPVDESHPGTPRTAYQIAKNTAEHVADRFADGGRAHITHLRPTLVTTCEKHYEVWSKNPDVRLKRSARDLFAYVDRRDVVDAVLLAAQVDRVGSRAFLLSAADTTSDRPTAELIAQSWPALTIDSTQLAHDHQSLIDCSRARRELGWTSRHTWRDDPHSRGTTKKEH